MKTQPPTRTYPYPTLAVDVRKLLDLHAAVAAAGCRYGFGKKVVPISSPAGSFREVDCSGYVDWLMHQCGVPAMPDGSYIQHDAVKAAKLKRSTPEALTARDGALRIAFIAPKGTTPGHVALFLDGLSIESHGGKGPNRRTVAQSSWLKDATVYVLTAPVAK